MPRVDGSCAHVRARTPLLPNECLLLIVRHCNAATLQNLRLASKAFQKLTDPVLWKEVRLVPNIDCLSSFCSMIGGRRIAAHVQTLIYDTSWQNLAEELKNKSSKIMDATDSGTSSVKSTSCQIIDKCVQAQVKSAEGSSAEVGLLTRVLLILSDVKNLASIESASTTKLDEQPPPYYRSVCNAAGIKTTDLNRLHNFGALRYVSHVRSLLLAAYTSGRKIDNLHLHEIPWTTFFQDTNSVTDLPDRTLGDFNLRREVFKGLKRFKISFRSTPSRGPNTHLRGLREILQTCENLESLEIRMTDHVQKKYSTDYRMFSYLAPLVEGRYLRPLMPKLRKLHLEGCVCTQGELVNLLMMHSNTLRDLTLSNISLMRQEDNDARGCWVRVIKSLRHTLRLDKMTFRDWLSNGGRQRWYVSHDPIVDSQRLRPFVENYVTRQSTQTCPCPLDSVAIRPGHEDVSKPLTGNEEEGDWTWAMTYGQSKTRGDRMESTFSGNDLFSKDVALNSTSPEPIIYWGDWNTMTSVPSYKKPFTYSNPHAKATSVSPKYAQGNYSSPGLPLSGFGHQPPPPPPPPPPHHKKLPAPKSIQTPAMSWSFVNPGSSIQDPWYTAFSPPPFSHHTASTSSKSNSTTSANSVSAPMNDDDIFIDEISPTPSPQQFSGHPAPPYTPSYSSQASHHSFDTFASWSQPAESYHSSTGSVTYYPGSNIHAGKPAASTHNAHSTWVGWDDPWADPFDFGAPPTQSLAAPGMPSMPKSTGPISNAQTSAMAQNASAENSQNYSKMKAQTWSFGHPPAGQHTSSFPAPGQPFTFPSWAEDVVKQNPDKGLKAKTGIEMYDGTGW